MKSAVLKIYLLPILFVLSGVAFGNETAWVNNAGYMSNPDRIDGPDYFGSEPNFKKAYETLKSRYGNDYLPDELPKELFPIRNNINAYLLNAETKDNGSIEARKSARAIVGKKRYESGYRGKNNPVGYRYWVTQLPTKITRLSYCFGISPRILTALMEEESEFIVEAVSGTGAYGLMQVTAPAAAEVLELLGYPNPYVSYNKDSAEIFKEYINCYLGKDRPWVNPWEIQLADGSSLVSPKCSEAMSNCSKSAVANSKTRKLKGISAENFDNWMIGAIEGGSPDYGLVIGAVLLKFQMGHYGVSKGVRNYNGDTSYVRGRQQRNRYRDEIVKNADSIKKMNLEVVSYELFGEMFEIALDGSDGQVEALDLLQRAAELWPTKNDYDEKVVNELRSLQLPGVNTQGKRNEMDL